MFWAVCALPINFRVLFEKVCGLMLMRVTLCFFNTSSFSFVMVSGLPASTVNSLTGYVSSLKILSRSFALSAVGVPPPM